MEGWCNHRETSLILKKEAEFLFIHQLTLGVKVGAALAAAHGEGGEGVLQDLLKPCGSGRGTKACSAPISGVYRGCGHRGEGVLQDLLKPCGSISAC